MTASNDPFALYADLFDAQAKSDALIPLVVTPVATPEEFSRSTILALKAQQFILEMPLVEDDPHYRTKLMAKASVASAQINAQLKSDETALKSRIAAVSYYDEIKAALQAHRLKG